MNRLFLTAITGECCMMAMHEIRPKAYNPFSLLRDQLGNEGVKLGKTRLEALLQLRHIYKDNNLKEHPLLKGAIEHEEKRLGQKYVVIKVERP